MVFVTAPSAVLDRGRCRAFAPSGDRVTNLFTNQSKHPPPKQQVALLWFISPVIIILPRTGSSWP